MSVTPAALAFTPAGGSALVFPFAIAGVAGMTLAIAACGISAFGLAASSPSPVCAIMISGAVPSDWVSTGCFVDSFAPCGRPPAVSAILVRAASLFSLSAGMAASAFKASGAVPGTRLRAPACDVSGAIGSASAVACVSSGEDIAISRMESGVAEGHSPGAFSETRGRVSRVEVAIGEASATRLSSVDCLSAGRAFAPFSAEAKPRPFSVLIACARPRDVERPASARFSKSLGNGAGILPPY